MELVDRYLQAVKLALPKRIQEDVVQELNDSILSQVEDKEAALGRPMSEEELVELLKKMGSPAQLASRYREEQGLIGPTFLPVYWKVLKVAIALSFLVNVIAAIVTAAAGRPLLESLAPILRFPGIAFTTFAWITLTFMGLHYFGAKFNAPERWDPRKLPPVEKTKRRKGRTESTAALVISAIATVWWLVGLRNPVLIMGPGVAFLTFAPVWIKLYPLWVLLGLNEVGRHFFEFLRPNDTKLHRIASLVPRTLSLIVMFFLIRAGELFVANPNNPALEPAMGAMNYGTRLGLTIAAVIALAKLLIDIWKLLASRFEQAHEAAMGS